jgi:hypothetical protein
MFSATAPSFDDAPPRQAFENKLNFQRAYARAVLRGIFH